MKKISPNYSEDAKTEMEVDAVKQEINKMVYKLYDIQEKEIRIIEGKA